VSDLPRLPRDTPTCCDVGWITHGQHHQCGCVRWPAYVAAQVPPRVEVRVVHPVVVDVDTTRARGTLARVRRALAALRGPR